MGESSYLSDGNPYNKTFIQLLYSALCMASTKIAKFIGTLYHHVFRGFVPLIVFDVFLEMRAVDTNLTTFFYVNSVCGTSGFGLPHAASAVDIVTGRSQQGRQIQNGGALNKKIKWPEHCSVID